MVLLQNLVTGAREALRRYVDICFVCNFMKVPEDTSLPFRAGAT